MKRKFSLFLNVAVLALCVCAIAIGVYSAKQASLNVSGTVGFTAHDCKVAVSGIIEGHSTTPDGAPEPSQPIESVTVKDTQTLNLGEIYFSDMTESGEINPITLTLNFENLSDFNVEVKLTPQTIAGITITPDKTSVILSNKSAEEADKKKTVVVTLTCTSTGIEPANKQILQVNMAKYTAPEGFIVQSGAIAGLTGNRNFVTMGTYTLNSETKDIKWYIFAQGDGSTMSAVTTNIVDNNAALPAGTYWFISEYVLGGSLFGSNGTYGGSTIQTYLEGDGESSFIGSYDIDKQTDSVYSAIDARDLPAEDANGNVGAFTAVPNQKLWLLSVKELSCLNNNNPVTFGNIFRNLVVSDIAGGDMYWWLRSPKANSDDEALSIDIFGQISIDIASTVNGVRPAFQITI